MSNCTFKDPKIALSLIFFFCVNVAILLLTRTAHPSATHTPHSRSTTAQVEAYRPRSRPGLPKRAGSGPHARTSPHARTPRSTEYKRSVQAHTHTARSRCTPYIRPISLRSQADPTCAAPCEATLSSPAHHAASEVEAPPSPITPFVSSCRYFPRSAHSVSVRMTYTAPCT